jgi:hypothetical protein
MNHTIVLGGRPFEIRPLKLGQLRHVLDALEEMTGKSGGGLIEAAARVVAAGLAPAHPDLTPDSILDLEATVEQLNNAVSAILQIAGLRPSGNARGDATMGEARSPDGRLRPADPGGPNPAGPSPAAAPASSSPPFTALLPLAAAMPTR